jgi:GlcNAc-P-P-Und epimerase
MIAVSGAHGFVGSHVHRTLTDAGMAAVGVVRRGGPENGMRVVADWSEAGLRAALAGVTAVVHAASVVHRPGADPAEYERFNRDGTRALIAAARGTGVRQVVLLSTIKVYGEERFDCADENTPPRPQDPYSVTKLAAEEIVLGASGEGGPIGTVLRLAPVYGRGDKGNVRRVISAIAGHRFVLPGSGSTRKSLVHVSTVAEVIRAALSQRKGGLFVVADREAPSMRELADAASAALGVRKATALPAWLLEAIALPVESACALMGREPPVSRALLRKSLIPTVCSPERDEWELV